MTDVHLTPAFILAFLCPLAMIAVGFVVFYFVAKTAVRNGMMEAFVQRGRVEAAAAIQAQRIAAGQALVEQRNQ